MGRCEVDAGEMPGKCEGDAGEMRGRCGGEMRGIFAGRIHACGCGCGCGCGLKYCGWQPAASWPLIPTEVCRGRYSAEGCARAKS